MSRCTRRVGPPHHAAHGVGTPARPPASPVKRDHYLDGSKRPLPSCDADVTCAAIAVEKSADAVP